MIRVLIVDDDPLVRAGLRLMLGGAADLELVGDAADGDEVAEAVRLHRPDVVLMDVRMPRLDGIAAVRALQASGLDVPPAVIVLTTFRADATVLEALRAGASGFLLKHTPPAEIVAAIRAAADGLPTVSPDALRQLIDYVAATESVTLGTGRSVRDAAVSDGAASEGAASGGAASDGAAPDGAASEGAASDPGAPELSTSTLDPLAALTEREREVAFAVAEGLGNAEIAERLFLSHGSVKAHISSALAKLALDNRIQLAVLAHQSRL